MKTNLLFVATLASLAVTGTGVGVANAVTTNRTVTPRRGIARYTLREERLNAVAQVLGTTPSHLEDELKTETMQQIIQSAGLTNSNFRAKVKAQVQSDLLAKGYSQSQVSNALSHFGRKGHAQANMGTSV